MLMKEKIILDNINLIYMVLKRYNLYNKIDELIDEINNLKGEK